MSTTEDGAYTLNGAMSDIALHVVARNSGATWFLPSEDEWYKAAYYDPATGQYHDFATGTDTPPDNNLPALDSGNSANYIPTVNYTTGNPNYPLTDAGSYTLSASPYGTFDQSGNVLEWNEAQFNLPFAVVSRGARGGAWNFSDFYMKAASRSSSQPSEGVDLIGFRVATVPEPGSLALAALGGMFAASLQYARARRCRRAKITA